MKAWVTDPAADNFFLQTWQKLKLNVVSTCYCISENLDVILWDQESGIQLIPKQSLAQRKEADSQRQACTNMKPAVNPLFHSMFYCAMERTANCSDSAGEISPVFLPHTHAVHTLSLVLSVISGGFALFFPSVITSPRTASSSRLNPHC